MIVKCEYCGAECDIEREKSNICPSCGAPLPVIERIEELKAQEELQREKERLLKLDFEEKKRDIVVRGKLVRWVVAFTFLFMMFMVVIIPTTILMNDYKKSQPKQHELRTGYYEYIRIYYYYDDGTWYYYDEDANEWVTEADYRPEWLDKTYKASLYEHSVDQFKEDYPDGVRFRK